MVTAKDLMTKNVITVKRETPVKELVKMMSENDIEAIPVLNDKEELIGIITDGDLVMRASKFHMPLFYQILDGAIFFENPNIMDSELKKMLGINAGEIMSKRVVSVTEDTPLEEIATIMVSRKIKRLPVVQGKKLVGIIGRKDILTVLAKNGE
jgi:CBS domain-containing protein